MKRHTPYFVLIACLIAIDQITKFLVANAVPFYGSVPVIPDFFNLSHIHNTGAIFGAFSQSGNKSVSILLTAAQLVALTLALYYFFRTSPSQKSTKIALSLILAGAVGNLIDRLGRGYVVDFVELHVKRFYWPTFNVADSCVTIGAFLLFFILILRRH